MKKRKVFLKQLFNKVKRERKLFLYFYEMNFKLKDNLLYYKTYFMIFFMWTNVF